MFFFFNNAIGKFNADFVIGWKFSKVTKDRDSRGINEFEIF